METKMMQQVENIIELAVLLIEEGKATIDNAFQMALEMDMQRCKDVVESIQVKHQTNGNKFKEGTKAHKASDIVCDSVHKRNKTKAL